MKGVILAGGSGSRLYPLTIAVSKQLLPVYDKPMIYYPLTTLLLAGVTEILIITRPSDQLQFQKLLGDGRDWGIEIDYVVQQHPAGLAEAPLLAKDFLAGEDMVLILGDNFLYGVGLGRQLREIDNLIGAKIFAYQLNNPQDYGVVELDSLGRPLSIEEKPKNPKSNLAIPGLYFFDSKVIDICSNLSPSPRGELEITDVLKEYLRLGELRVQILPFGTAWLDMGSFDNLLGASEFVQTIQSRQGVLIGDPTTAAKMNNSVPNL